MIKIICVNIALFILTFSFGQNSETLKGLISNPEARSNLLDWFICGNGIILKRFIMPEKTQ